MAGKSNFGNLMRAQTLIPLLCALAVFAYVLLSAYYRPYFPGHFDDSEHWLWAFHMLDEWRAAPGWLDKISSLYLVRQERPIFFPMLGMPFLAWGVNIPAATALLNASFLCLLWAILFRIFRELGATMLAAAAVAFFLAGQPTVLTASEVFLSELPFLVLFCGAALARVRGNFHWQGWLLAAGLCLRPVEGVTAIGMGLAADFSLAQAGSRAKLMVGWLKALAWASAGCVLWYGPFFGALRIWVVPALVSEGPAPSISRELTLNLLSQTLSPLLLPLFLLAAGADWLRSRSWRRPALAVFLYAVPFCLALQAENISSIMETRRYVFFLLLSAGILLSSLLNARFLLVALAVAQITWSMSRQGENYRRIGGHNAHLACLSLLRPLEKAPVLEHERFFLFSNHGLSALTCGVTARMLGKKWRFFEDPPWLPVPFGTGNGPEHVAKTFFPAYTALITDGSLEERRKQEAPEVGLAQSFITLRQRGFFREYPLQPGQNLLLPAERRGESSEPR